MPRYKRTALRFLGGGKFLMASARSGKSLIPWADTECPQNEISCYARWSLSRFRVNPAFSNLIKISFRCPRCSVKELEYTTKSSITLYTNFCLRSPNNESTNLYSTWQPTLIPIGNLMNSESPKGVQKAVTLRLLADNGIWYYAELRSSTENTLA
jgi:hypothetical protein